MPSTYKRCNHCHTDKPSTEYYVNSRGSLKQPCKECAAVKRKAQRTEHQAQVHEVIKYFYGGWQCIKCGFEGVPAQMDAHHRTPSTKSFSISDAKKMKLSDEDLKAELVKCDLLCACCHRLEHVVYD